MGDEFRDQSSIINMLQNMNIKQDERYEEEYQRLEVFEVAQRNNSVSCKNT